MIRFNTNGYKILTPNGWKDFDGVRKNVAEEIITVYTSEGRISGTPEHKVYINDNDMKTLGELKIGETIKGKENQTVIKIEREKGSTEVYDVLEVKDGNKFYANDIVSSNCEFIGKSNGLIDTSILREIMESTRIQTYNYTVDSDIRFYKSLEKNKKYLIALDPSMGIGGDSAAIQVFEFPTFEQVAEWKSETTNQNDQVEKIKALTDWMYSDLKSKGCYAPEIYWSFENNSLGEGIVSILREKASNLNLMSPQSYIKRGTLITQAGNKRIGFTTDKRSKTMACTQLKTMIENKTITLHSNLLVKELSTYTLQSINTNYSATSGEHDDLISASLIIVNMYLQCKGSLDLTSEIHVEESEKKNISYDLPFLFSIS